MKIIHLIEMIPFLHENNTILTHHFGFRAKHGTVELDYIVTNEIRKALKYREFQIY